MVPPPAAAPARTAAPPAAAPGRPRLPLRPPLARPRRRERTGRLTRGGVAASVALHLAAAFLIMLVPGRERPLPGDDPAAAVPAPAAGEVAGEAVSYLDVGVWPAGAATPSGIPAPSADAFTAPAAGAAADGAARDTARVEAPPGFPARVPSGLPPALRAPAAPGAGGGAAPGAGAGAGAGPESPGGRGGAGVRLGPEYGDARLVVPPAAATEREMGDMERYLVEFYMRLQALNDSLVGEADRERRLREWVWTDSNGKEWGVRDGKIIVNGEELPLPPIALPPGDRQHEDERRRNARWREEIDRQAESIERDRHLRDRGRAIRDRVDRDRGGGNP